MSLLPATSHANPTTPFWATGGGGSPVVVFGNSSPVYWFKNFDVTPPDNIVDIQTFTVPEFPTNGKLVVQANWSINSAGQDALMYFILAGNYANATDDTNIEASKGIFGQSLTMTFDYVANTTDWTMTQQVENDPGGSAVDIGGYATMSVIFYPT